MSLRKQGKADIKTYYELHLKKSTDYKSLFLGILLTLITVAPLVLVVIQVFQVYFYHPIIKITVLILAWMLIMFCNGLSNFYTIKLAKLYYKENEKLNNLNEKAILLYESTNIGFGLFLILAIILLGAYYI